MIPISEIPIECDGDDWDGTSDATRATCDGSKISVHLHQNDSKMLDLTLCSLAKEFEFPFLSLFHSPESRSHLNVSRRVHSGWLPIQCLRQFLCNICMCSRTAFSATLSVKTQLHCLIDEKIHDAGSWQPAMPFSTVEEAIDTSCLEMKRVLCQEAIIACCGNSKCVKKEETRWRRASDQRPVTTAPQTQTAHHMSEKEGER